MVDSLGELNEAYNSVVARYYDAVYGPRPDLVPNRDFYVRAASEAGGTVLELGCGTGRVLLELVRRRIPCVGLDSSRAMLDRLREKAGEQAPELVRAQMQAFDLGARRFALVCAPFRGFQHLYDVKDQRACLACVRSHLESGGCFVFDVTTAFDEERAPLEEPEQMDASFYVDAVRVRRYVSKRRDPALRLTVLTMRFELCARDASVKSEWEVVNMRWFRPDELRALMLDAGFEKVSLRGDYDDSPVTVASRTLIVTGRNP